MRCVSSPGLLLAGAVGHVIGQHAYVLVDFAAPVAEQVTTGDTVTVTAVGQGLALPGHPAIVVKKNADPGRRPRCPADPGWDGRAEVHVAARVPAEAVGAGGTVSEYANTDLMGAYAGLGEDLSLGLEGLRIGDIVAVADADHRFGRGYRPGYLTIGVISTGQCMLLGAQAGPRSPTSGPRSAPVDDPDANLAASAGTATRSRASECRPGRRAQRGRRQHARGRRAPGAR